MLAAALPARGAESDAAAARLVRLGNVPTPALALSDLDGKPAALAEYRDRVVLVNFWATWCGPCVVEMPALQALADRFGERRLAVLGVDYGEGPAKVRAFRERTGLRFRLLLDPNKAAAAEWGVRVLPTSFLIGPDGRVRYAAVGALDWTGAEVAAAIEELLK